MKVGRQPNYALSEAKIALAFANYSPSTCPQLSFRWEFAVHRPKIYVALNGEFVAVAESSMLKMPKSKITKK